MVVGVARAAAEADGPTENEDGTMKKDGKRRSIKRSLGDVKPSRRTCEQAARVVMRK